MRLLLLIDLKMSATSAKHSEKKLRGLQKEEGKANNKEPYLVISTIRRRACCLKSNVTVEHEEEQGHLRPCCLCPSSYSVVMFILSLARNTPRLSAAIFMIVLGA